jgi:hypothetical protein
MRKQGVQLVRDESIRVLRKIRATDINLSFSMGRRLFHRPVR